MSADLRKVAGKLIKLASFSPKDIKATLNHASRRLIAVLSEIALNAKEGIFQVSNKVKHSKIVKILSDKTRKLKEKKTILRTIAAPIIVRLLLNACITVLQSLCKNV